jgi:hypothetical protein
METDLEAAKHFEHQLGRQKPSLLITLSRKPTITVGVCFPSFSSSSAARAPQ